MEEKRKVLRADRKSAGHDALLRAAMDRFGLSRKVALDIWNGAPHDRKGGRPKRAKPDIASKPTIKKAPSDRHQKMESQNVATPRFGSMFSTVHSPPAATHLRG
jgi:hypothetical protein